MFIKNNRFKNEWSTNHLRISRPGVKGYDLPPLTQSLNNFSKAKQVSSVNVHNYDTHVSTFPSGLRVASEKLFGDFCTVGGIKAHTQLF
jgi:hypothetical protein